MDNLTKRDTFVPGFESRKTSNSRRGVAQPGLEYASGGRVVAGSNPVTPTEKERFLSESFFFVYSQFKQEFYVMNNATYIICAVVLLLIFVLYYLDRYNKINRIRRNMKSDETAAPEPEPVPAGECCGKHAVCEKQKLAEARLRQAQYFDDEDLDRFRGRSSDSYQDDEVEEFRYVMYTMQQNEVREWMECLQAREIELPDELKEECYSMMNEID